MTDKRARTNRLRIVRERLVFTWKRKVFHEWVQHSCVRNRQLEQTALVVMKNRRGRLFAAWRRATEEAAVSHEHVRAPPQSLLL